MRIEDLRIERFGRWRETTLSLPDPSVNVLYGPNEAGKSTLLRFVRGVLYGRGSTTTDRRAPEELHGRLIIERDGNRYAIERHYDPSGDKFDIDGIDGPSIELASLLQGVERSFFERVYAVGLREMQELGTLDDEAVAEWLYGTSLGPAGRRLGEVGALASRSRSSLFGSKHEPGRIAELTNEYARISRELDGLDDPGRHDALRTERDELETKVDRLQRNQQDLQRNLRGLRALARVHEPWQQVNEYRSELDRLGRARQLPDDGLDSLSRVDERIADIRAKREATAKRVKGLIAESKKLGGSAASRDDDLGDHACTLRALLDQREEIRDVHQRIGEIGGRIRSARTDFDRALEELGPDWNEKRIGEVSGTTDGHSRLNAAARDYQKGLVRRARLRRLRKRLAKTVKKRQAELHERTRSLGGKSVKDAIADRRQRLVDLEELGRTRVRAAELEQRRQSLAAQIEWSRKKAGLPDWVHGVLVFFAITGTIFFLLGMATGIQTSWLVGAIYALLGMTVGGFAWAIKVHFEEEVRDSLRHLRDEENTAETELRETHRRIARLQGTSLADVGKLTLKQQQERDAELVGRTVREVVDLERLMERIDSTVSLRKRQTIVRNRFHSLQRELGSAREKWAGTIRALGLGETLKIDEAVGEWDRVTIAVDARRRLRSAEAELSRERNVRERFRSRLQKLAVDLGEKYDDDRALELLDGWAPRLKTRSNKGDDRRRELRREIRSGRREYDRLRTELSKWLSRRSTLFARAGVGSRTEFRKLVGSAGRRTELEELLALAEADLESAIRGDEDLAIVEEQLVDYDPEAAGESIELAELEIEENEAKLRKALERLGHVKKSLADAEGDTRAATLRFERERVYEELREATRDLAASELVDRAAESTMGELERSHQPPTLAAASRYLRKLTLGRYDRVWTPFGESRLLVNGEGHEGLGVEKLSRGTREQVFLALRLAMIDQLAEGSAERPPVRLPLVLDDVFVNFDRDRTEAAVDTLIDFARDGRQVLFLTCHEHVALMFEDRGIEPVWLPANEARFEERVA